MCSSPFCLPATLASRPIWSISFSIPAKSDWREFCYCWPSSARKASRKRWSRRNWRVTRHTRDPPHRQSPTSYIVAIVLASELPAFGKQRRSASGRYQRKRLPGKSPIDSKVIRIGGYDRMLAVKLRQSHQAGIGIVHTFPVAHKQSPHRRRFIGQHGQNAQDPAFDQGEYLLPRIGHRSEEHTSELQSLRHLVCRLLLEKKKDKK